MIKFLCYIALSLTFSLFVLPNLIGSVNAQKNDPLVPMKVADEFKNDYQFEDALEWYEKVIQDFPDTLEAGNASLHKLVILFSQSNWYKTLVIDFLQLTNAQLKEASKYSVGSSYRKEEERKLEKFEEKVKKYQKLSLQKGKTLREEFYRFEKHYASWLDKLSIPYIKEVNKIPFISYVEEGDIEQILLLDKDSYLEHKDREICFLNIAFQIFCLQYIVLGGESPTNIKEAVTAYYNKEYSGRKINVAGFYYWLGIGLNNSYQFKSALNAFTKVITLAKDDSYSKLAYEAEKGIKDLKDNSSQLIVT